MTRQIRAFILVSLCWIGALHAQTNLPSYSLDQFGPVNTLPVAEATFQKASQDIIAAGGGVLLIPTNTVATWKPKNISQTPWWSPPLPAPTTRSVLSNAVTVVDTRGGTLKLMVPQLSGMEIIRTLDLPEGDSLPFWGMYPMVHMQNTILRGSNSYRDWLQEDVKTGQDARFYVATIRGLFPGAYVTVSSYPHGVVRVHAKTLGYDKEKKLWYFTADTDADVQKGEVMGNKNHVNVLAMDTYSHNENQTCDIMLERHNFSQGDNYMYMGRFHYTGDNHSTAGDENHIVYGAFVQNETAIFHGKVEKWDAVSQALKFAEPVHDETLGSGRPIINLNPAKWITNGTVQIVRPASWTDTDPNLDNAKLHGQAFPTTIEKNRVGVNSLRMGGVMRFSADAPVTEDAVGRYFAVDSKDEYVPTPGNKALVRRWFLIDSVTKNPDGTKDVRIIRHWWGAKSAGSPVLYKPENYSADGHEAPLPYIIAPGANAYDVSDGVKNIKRTLKLVPTSFTGTAADFAPGDEIEQAIGPDPWKPTAFRAFIWNHVPSSLPSSVFDVANMGSVMLDTVLSVHAGNGDIEIEKAKNYDRNPHYDRIITVDSACNTGIKFAGDTGDAALLFAQPHDRVQPIKWYYGPTNEPPKIASLTVSRQTGALNFTGPISATGLSADSKTPARNLRGKDVAVKAGATSVPITFATEEADASYAVFVEQSWLGIRAITKKETKGFTIQFEKPAPADAKLDWMIVR